jgi:uncharacterized protein YrrD
MLRSFKDLCGFSIRATDAHTGTVRDIYFDDSSWRIRYCVVDSGRWFAGRDVLVSPRALSILDSRRRELWVRLSSAEVTRSRTADSDKPVSRQRGIWRIYAHGAAHDGHLRSCNAVIGHELEATDGKIGRVEDFLIDDKTWVIQDLIIDARKLAGSRVLVASRHVGGINWARARVSVALTRAAVATAPTYDQTHHASTLLPPLAG